MRWELLSRIRVFFSREVVRLIKDSKELSKAGGIVFKRSNSKQENGAIGILSYHHPSY